MAFILLFSYLFGVKYFIAPNEDLFLNYSEFKIKQKEVQKYGKTDTVTESVNYFLF